MTMSRGIPIFALLLALAAISDATCPNMFIHHDQTCYFFSHGTVDWASAITMCTKLLDAKLVTISDAAENNFVASQVRQQNRNYWLGGNDIRSEGEWTWVSTGQRVTAYTDWGPGEPNNYKGDENCMAINAAGYWYDDGCFRNNKYYICERPYSGSQSDLIG